MCFVPILSQIDMFHHLDSSDCSRMCTSIWELHTCLIAKKHCCTKTTLNRPPKNYCPVLAQMWQIWSHSLENFLEAHSSAPLIGLAGSKNSVSPAEFSLAVRCESEFNKFARSSLATNTKISPVLSMDLFFLSTTLNNSSITTPHSL
uniref:Uncharacterized protein n=1 Tax=Pyxicephalus adspersus TaxID=30357 RepID=A0AAV2ZL02_PYXAD|nr:TPA: hypothetical protein GDO54_016817 [Pyxicephalus adspersus]